MSNTKKIRIIDCRDPMMWYLDHIGREFIILEEDDLSYMVRDVQGYRNIVYKDDAELLDETSI
jgi:hypothetical protein